MALISSFRRLYSNIQITVEMGNWASIIDAVVNQHKLDALVTLTSGPAWFIDYINGDRDTGGCTTPAAVAGYPHITVPAGFYGTLPIGLSFFGTAWSEPTLLKLAYAWEQETTARRKPAYAPSAPSPQTGR